MATLHNVLLSYFDEALKAKDFETAWEILPKLQENLDRIAGNGNGKK